jgi:hypothetical protein
MFDSPATFVIWLFCTWVVANIIIGFLDATKEDHAEFRKKLLKHLDEIVHRVSIEKHSGIYYWFDKDNDKFLAQGKTDKEIIEILKQRFPDHIFYLESTNHLLSAKHNWEPVEAQKH